jgi:hypothetical protein
VLAPKKPIVGKFAGCCARAASGHAADDLCNAIDSCQHAEQKLERLSLV